MTHEQRISTQLRLEYASAIEDCALIQLPHRSLISLTGEDRIDWLQGQSTNDLRNLKPGDSVSFCLCSPKGQIEAIIDALILDHEIWLSTDSACKPAVLDRIENMVVMEDAAGREVDHLICVRIVGPEAANASTYTVGILGQGFKDVWIDESQLSILAASIPSSSEETYNIWRLEQGIPKWNQDATAKTLPSELGPAFEQAHVSYTKGCYTGQEVLQRIHSRGHTNKTWVALQCDGAVAQGSAVTLDGTEMGLVSSVAHSPRYGYLAAATLRNAAMDGEALVQIGDKSARVMHFPIKKSA